MKTDIEISVYPVPHGLEQTQRELSTALGSSNRSHERKALHLTANIEDLLPSKKVIGRRQCGHGSSISSCRGSIEKRRMLIEKPWDGQIIASLSKIMSFQFEPLIERMMDKLGWPEDVAREAFEDLKRYFYLCGIYPEPFAAPLVIDEMWHEFQMFSEEYRQFCTEYIGFFVDHKPKTRDEPMTDEIPLVTLEAAMKTFGTLSSNWRFPTVAELEHVNRHGLTAELMNH